MGGRTSKTKFSGKRVWTFLKPILYSGDTIPKTLQETSIKNGGN